MEENFYLKSVDDLIETDITKEELIDSLRELFIDTYDTVVVSHLITDEAGNITIPGIVTANDGTRYPALFDVNVFITGVENTVLIVEDIGYIAVEAYIDYLGDWAEDFEPYEIEFLVDYLE